MSFSSPMPLYVDYVAAAYNSERDNFSDTKALWSKPLRNIKSLSISIGIETCNSAKGFAFFMHLHSVKLGFSLPDMPLARRFFVP